MPASTPVACHVASPLGELILLSDDTGKRLAGLWVIGEKHAPPSRAAWRRDDAALPQARRQLAEYFSGKRTAFDLPLAAEGTPFQLQAWQALRAISYGTTITYGQQAAAIGKPTAYRAIGLANGRNPLAIIVPCHRVIGANGALTGYGGGLAAKRWLLDHEAHARRRKPC
jgi:methylated-DNA-[protein]-cysteine S-methyltransferase